MILKYSKPGQTKNQMKFNVDKCTILHFGRNNPNKIYKLYGEKLKNTECERDLGILIDNRLTFKHHLLCVRKKCFRLINIFFKLFHSNDGSFFVRLFEIYIRPVL